MGKTKTETIRNLLNGEEAAITWIQHENHGRKIPIIKKEVNQLGKKKEQPIPITTTEAPEVAKVAKKEVKKPKLTDIEQKVLDFIKTLDHPATSNEVRDEFGFPLRANARRIFRKLEKQGFGENRKVGNRYLFYVKGKEYPKSETKTSENTKKS